MQRGRLKVALLSFDFGEYCVRLPSALARRAKVCLLLPYDQAAPYLSELDPAVDFCPFSKPRLRQPLRQTRMVWTLLRRIREFEPHVVHMHMGHLWFNLALPLLRRYPLVITIQDPRHHPGDRSQRRTPQRILDFGYHLADHVIVHGGQLRQVVVNR